MTSHRSDEPRLFWEDFRRLYPVKAFALAVIIALTVVSCGKEASLSLAIDDLNYDSLPAKAPRPTKPAEKLHAAVLELKELLTVQSGKNLTEKQAELAHKARAAVAGNLAAVEKQFAADREKLGDLEAKDALKRLAVIEGKTDEIKSDLIDALAVVPKSGERSSSARTAIKQLTALSPDKPQQPLSSDLSFGIKNAKPRSVSLSAGITPAYQAPSPDAEPSSLPREPEPADLEETDETKITPAIEQLATELDHDPVKIYEYVRNNVKFEPYYGIRKGADQTLAEKAGSDADQAALLIALMRESGVPARFVQGVAELPAAKAANWLGVDVANGERMDAVPEILWSGGIPTTAVRANGELVKVKFTHVWVEVSVDGDAYRGVDEPVTGARRWTSLAPSVKQTHFEQPVADFGSLLAPASNSWVETIDSQSQDLGDGGVVAPPEMQVAEATEDFLEQAESIFQDHGVDEGADASALFGKRSVRVSNPGYLPLSMPFRAISVQSEYRDMQRSFEASIAIEVSGSDPMSMPGDDVQSGAGFTYSAPTKDLADKRITVAYVPETAEDADIIDEYHGLLNGPSYIASLIPVLRVDGEVVARGNVPSHLGYQQRIAVQYSAPGLAPDRTESPIDVGALMSLGLSVGGSAKRLEARATALAGSTIDADGPAITDRAAGELFSQFAALYFLRNDRFNDALARVAGVHAQRQVSGAFVGTYLSGSYVGGFPISVGLRGIAVDVDQDAQSVVAATEQAESVRQFARASGSNASLTESDMLTAVMGGEAASSVQIFASASRQQIPVYRVNESNLDDALVAVNASSHVESEIRDLVLRGNVTVTIPASPVTIGAWTGTGYIVESPNASDFRIEGGLSGGVLVSDGSDPTSSLGAASVKSASLSIAAVAGEDPCEMRYWARVFAVFTVIGMVFWVAVGGPAGWIMASALLLGFIAEIRHIQELDEECRAHSGE